mmetsp:Transcript_17540/g.35396  ORF Transcript_17540/g.35396 Transcript_17540/m.35396 type:complete len:263 (+) Transcript_17540:808-1596(+)
MRVLCVPGAAAHFLLVAAVGVLETILRDEVLARILVPEAVAGAVAHEIGHLLAMIALESGGLRFGYLQERLEVDLLALELLNLRLRDRQVVSGQHVHLLGALQVSCRLVHLREIGSFHLRLLLRALLGFSLFLLEPRGCRLRLSGLRGELGGLGVGGAHAVIFQLDRDVLVLLADFNAHDLVIAKVGEHELLPGHVVVQRVESKVTAQVLVGLKDELQVGDLRFQESQDISRQGLNAVVRGDKAVARGVRGSWEALGAFELG